MKKIMKPFVLVAAAAIALASCQKNEMPAPEKQDVHFTINAGIETKTSITDNGNGSYTPSWDGNEELGVLFAAPNAETTANDVVTLTNAKSGSLASFQGTVTVDEPAGTFYAFYPAAAFNRGYAEGDSRLDLKNVQKPTATSFDPSCDILVAKPYNYEVVEGKVVADGLEFARLMSVLRIDLKSEFTEVQNEFVESVSFTAGDVKITGYARIFLDNPEFTGNWASSGEQWCTVTANYDSDLVSINGTSNSVYLVIAPVTIPANKDLTFEIKTKNYNISKTIKSPEMKFTAGKVSKINLTIAADNCDKIDTSIDYSGEWLITGVKDSQTYAVSAYVDGNNLDVLVPITVADEKITEVDGLANCKMTITKVLDGDYAGMYTIEDANSTEQKRSYLYAAGTGNNNYLKASSTLSAGSYWDITKNDNGTYTIIASKHSTERNTIWYNTSSNIFSCYQSNSTSYKSITLYPYSMVVPDTTPKLELGEESIELTAAGGEGTIAVTAKNLTAEIQVRALTAEGAHGKVDWLTAEYADETITYTAAANESTEARTAYIEVYVSDDLKTGVSVTQEGKPAEGAPVEVTDVLTRATTGVTKNSTSYSAWSGKTSNSEAVYAGQSAGGNDAIQLRSTNSNSGVVTTASGGKVKKIKVTWQSSTTSGRTLDIYGKNTAYTAATDLYNTSTQGTKLGSIQCGTSSTELVISGDYEYIGFRSNSGALYLTDVEITWETSGSGGDVTPDPEPEQPTLTPRNLAFSSTTATATVGQAFNAPTLSGVTTGVTYSSSNTGVATVNNSGVVTIVAAGTTTITASAPATNEYEAGTASYTLTVSQASTTKSWKLVKDPSTLKAGDKLAIVSTAKGKMASATISSGYMTEKTVTISNNSFTTLPSGAAELTLGGNSGAWTLTNSSGKKLGATAVKKVAWGSGTTTWTITIASNGDATIQSTTSSYGRFLHNVNSTRFTTYTSATNASMLLPQIYRYE